MGLEGGEGGVEQCEAVATKKLAQGWTSSSPFQALSHPCMKPGQAFL